MDYLWKNLINYKENAIFYMSSSIFDALINKSIKMCCFFFHFGGSSQLYVKCPTYDSKSDNLLTGRDSS